MAGQRALVTGGGSGIGEATAVRMAAAGASVAVLDVRESNARSVASTIVAAGGVAVGLRADVGDAEEVAAAVAAAADSLGGLDTVVCCAGVLFGGRLHELDVDDWDLVVRINLTGMFLTLKYAVPHLLAAGGGTIVTIGSVASLVHGGASPAYDASKGGVLAMTRAVAVQYADDGIRANCVCPGAVATNLRATSDEVTGARAAASSAGPSRLRVQVPMARHADPGEIAAVVAFLCSDDSSFITGAAVPVDGGFTAV
jgi:NAD(P)-dependent dehydrogenase (short-subunit alcohol dehydrogenase family)